MEGVITFKIKVWKYIIKFIHKKKLIGLKQPPFFIVTTPSLEYQAFIRLLCFNFLPWYHITSFILVRFSLIKKWLLLALKLHFSLTWESFFSVKQGFLCMFPIKKESNRQWSLCSEFFYKLCISCATFALIYRSQFQ